MITNQKNEVLKLIRSNLRGMPQVLAVWLSLGTVGGLNSVLLGAEAFSRTNSASIFITDSSPYTPAALYPSTISVSGLTQQVAHVSVTVWGLEHNYSPDLSILLVGPQGQSVVLMSQTGEGQALSLNWLTFDD